MAGPLKSIVAVGALALYLAAGPLAAAPEGTTDQGILNEDSLTSADPVALSNDSHLLQSIGDGLILALARCREDKSCDLSTSEVKHFLNLLNQRINLIGIRHAQTGQKALEPVLVSYADERDKLDKVLKQLKKVMPPKRQNDENGSQPAGQSSPP